MAPFKFIALACCAMYLASSSDIDNTRIVQSAKKQFQETDTNKDNIISLKQMINSYDELLSAGFDKSKIQKLTKETFDEYDLDANGFEWEEYLNMTLTKVEQKRKEVEKKRLDPPELDSV